MDRPAVADYPRGANLPSRVIDDFELVWMLRGHAKLTGAEALTLSPGELLLLPPGVAHGFEWDATRPSRHGYVHFGPEHFGGPRPAHIAVRGMTRDDPLEGLCSHLLWLGRLDGERWREHAGRTLGFLLSIFVDCPLPDRDEPPALAPPLAAAIDHLREAWGEMPLRRIGVEELAAAVFVSRGYLSRLFRAAFGHSPAPALERARCGRAETLLVRTDLTVDVVARQCGFADPSHFSHRFVALHGVPPRVYRTAPASARSVLDDPGMRRFAHLLWG